MEYKWYRAEGKLFQHSTNRTIDFGFWIGAKNAEQAKKRIERNYEKRKDKFILESLEEDPVGPGGSNQ